MFIIDCVWNMDLLALYIENKVHGSRCGAVYKDGTFWLKGALDRSTDM